MIHFSPQKSGLPSIFLTPSFFLGNLAAHRPQKTAEGERTAAGGRAVARSGEQKGRGERDGETAAHTPAPMGLGRQPEKGNKAGSACNGLSCFFLDWLLWEVVAARHLQRRPKKLRNVWEKINQDMVAEAQVSQGGTL